MLVNGDRHVRRGLRGSFQGKRRPGGEVRKLRWGKGNPGTAKEKAHTARGGRVKVHWVGVPLT